MGKSLASGQFHLLPIKLLITDTGTEEKQDKQLNKHLSSPLPRGGLCRHVSSLLPSLSSPYFSKCAFTLLLTAACQSLPVLSLTSPSACTFVQTHFFLSPAPATHLYMFQQRHHILFSLIQILVHNRLFPAISKLSGTGTGQFIASSHKGHPCSALLPNSDF